MQHKDDMLLLWLIIKMLAELVMRSAAWKDKAQLCLPTANIHLMGVTILYPKTQRNNTAVFLSHKTSIYFCNPLKIWLQNILIKTRTEILSVKG